MLCFVYIQLGSFTTTSIQPNIIIQKDGTAPHIRTLLIDFEAAYISPIHGMSDLIKLAQLRCPDIDVQSITAELTYGRFLPGIYDPCGGFYGVPMFASRHTHQGIRDTLLTDVEALVFSFAHAMNPEGDCLPWCTELQDRGDSHSTSHQLVDFYDIVFREKQKLAWLVLQSDTFIPKGSGLA
eukprot:gnl/Dysnectes_brevis/3990_a5202_656.p3 GENE.gnl/Dysnectes_brevis/3990_a5202_656~~gnl/Dysnectes_brevis/3990_a5202_656.p3  ORF type:complete len:182 (+),score=28.94 gnl/Dysnectes_brevis/3990_a5202_656:348-893(+)